MCHKFVNLKVEDEDNALQHGPAPLQCLMTLVSFKYVLENNLEKDPGINEQNETFNFFHFLQWLIYSLR